MDASMEKEATYILNRKYKCPVCGHEILSPAVRTGKVRTVGSDTDLRPRFEQVDSLKYGIVLCPNCGYAAYNKDFKDILDRQKALVREKVTPGFKYNPPELVITYDDALARYRIALANCMVIGAKNSRTANVALRLGWVIRGKIESLDKAIPGYEAEVKKLEAEEDKFLKVAYQGFTKAREVEEYPIAGMDEPTLDFLIGALSVRFGEFNVASKLLSNILLNKNATDRMKDKARDLKEEITAKMKEQEG